MGLHETCKHIWIRRKSLTWKVENEIELSEVLTNITLNTNQLIFIEVVMSQGDQPELLAKLGERFGKQNS